MHSHTKRSVIWSIRICTSWVWLPGILQIHWQREGWYNSRFNINSAGIMTTHTSLELAHMLCSVFDVSVGGQRGNVCASWLRLSPSTLGQNNRCCTAKERDDQSFEKRTSHRYINPNIFKPAEVFPMMMFIPCGDFELYMNHQSHLLSSDRLPRP